MSQTVDPTREATITLTLAHWNTVLMGLHELQAKHSLQAILALNAQLQPQIQGTRVPSYPAPGNHAVDGIGNAIAAGALTPGNEGVDRGSI